MRPKPGTFPDLDRVQRHGNRLGTPAFKDFTGEARLRSGEIATKRRAAVDTTPDGGGTD